jgi:hypothetical protein
VKKKLCDTVPLYGLIEIAVMPVWVDISWVEMALAVIANPQ